MTISAMLLPEFEVELTNTRKLIAVCPDAKAAWKPHPKSTNLGDLALHISNLIRLTESILTKAELDFAPPGGQPVAPAMYASTAATLAAFDANVEAALKALGAASDADMAVEWALKMGGRTIFKMPRSACVRMAVLNHLIHHRGQLSVYLRLLDVPLPKLYGPTADVPM